MTLTQGHVSKDKVTVMSAHIAKIRVWPFYRRVILKSVLPILCITSVIFLMDFLHMSQKKLTVFHYTHYKEQEFQSIFKRRRKLT